MKENKIKKPYFSHDYTPLEDKNLLKLFIAKGVEGYGLYWLIVEFMHQNTFAVGEENLLAFKFRTDTEKIKSVMNDFQLFHIEEHEDKKIYVSDRIQRNLDYAEEKNKDKKQAANIRWLLAAFNKAYIELKAYNVLTCYYQMSNYSDIPTPEQYIYMWIKRQNNRYELIIQLLGGGA